MKAVLALVSAFALAAPSAPEPPMWSDAAPPARFRGDNAAIVIFASNVGEYCHVTPPPGMRLIACTTPAQTGGLPVVVLPNPGPIAEAEWYARIVSHELGHVNGWRHEP